jgi:Ran GTPase-activating protein (RanGAP) involved in mRNA processing and transport
MNAVWGSKTLRELKLDNNNIRDRGAQLAAVALTSIDFEVLDLGFNRVTTVGIKALMKSISETTSLESLTLSGIPLDATACKAVSYALAYNCSLRELHVDNCQVGYSGQRHIVAGIVSNRWSSLRVVTGFDIGGE